MIEINPGEIRTSLISSQIGKISLAELGFSSEDLFLEGGLLRLVISLEGVNKAHFFKVPTIELSYQEEMDETLWIVDYNENKILEKTDHHGRSTVLLLNRNTLDSLEHRHENTLVVHAEFNGAVHLEANSTFIHLF